MLNAMRIQALDYLFQQLETGEPPHDIEDWYRKIHANASEKIFHYLVESSGQIERIYVIEKGENHALLTVLEMHPDIEASVPFIKPTGSQGAQIGPVIKRSYDKAKGAGPSAKILNTTMKSFAGLAQSGRSWAKYFNDILSILSIETIQLADGSICNWAEAGYDSMLECVVDKIGPNKGTVLIAVKTTDGRLPGQSPEYSNYLMNEILAGDRYLTQKIVAATAAQCPLCGLDSAVVYPNALKGAGINLTNVDRAGRFPGMNIDNAWKSFSLCAECADLLYIYKNHVLKKGGPKNDIRPFTAPVAGDQALIIPLCTTDAKTRFEVWAGVKHYVARAGTDVEYSEDDLLDVLTEHREGLINLTFLWCQIGQSLENVAGILTDVLPSRLSALSRFNVDAKATWCHPIFPEIWMRTKNDRLDADLALSSFRSLFRRPGGKKAPNATRRLFELKRAIAGAVYHDRTLPGKYQKRLWDEILVTAQWWWLDTVHRGDAYGLLHEGKSKKGKENYLTPAGWIRHWAWWLYYLKQLGVMKMENDLYLPELDDLKPYFGPESGINTQQKAYAFLLGVLYGKLLEIQGARGVNVGANSLTWLKRLRLKGDDLPELYIKTREKLLAYAAEKNEKIRTLIAELGNLAIKLGDPIELSQTQTNYYLLLGQSMAKTILKKEEK